MLTCIYKTIFSRFSNKKIHADLKPQSKRIDKMADKIDAMNETMNKTSPKIFSIFMILTTIPSFYFGYKMITQPYNSKQFTQSCSANLTYINIKNIVFFSCLSALNKFKFNSPTAKHTLPKVGIIGSIVPPLLTFIALCLPPSDSKYIVLPTLLADISTLAVQAQAANFGLYPFWLYSYRHYIRFFDWFVIIATFFALNNMNKRIKSHTHQFTQVQLQKYQQIQKNKQK